MSSAEHSLKVPTLHILTLFPEFFISPLKTSLLGKAIEKKIINIQIHYLRTFTTNKHNKVDDIPYGGGAGMVLQVEPIDRAITYLKEQYQNIYSVLLTPRGKRFNQATTQRYCNILPTKDLVFVCGHYEGVDQRVADFIVDESLSIGDYILSGGEPAVLSIVDSIARLVPGFMGNPDSIVNESFAHEGYIEPPQYTRPAIYKDLKVPEVLINGNHQKIKEWRDANSHQLDGN